MNTNGKPKAITVAIVAMGGEGGGVLADWIVDLAENSGFCAQTTSVPGVAQRTGATIYYLELFPEAAVGAAGKDPVLALMPVPGELDIVLASELMEAGRAIERGLVTPDRTTLITSTHRVYSMTERTAVSDGRVDAAKLIEAGRAAAKVFVHADFARIAEETRSVISAVLFGALAGAQALPFTRTQFENAIRSGGVGVDSSLQAFQAGFLAAAQGSAAATAGEIVPSATTVGPRLQPLATRIEHTFPPPAHAILMAGIQRLADYQDVEYAAGYLDVLDPIHHLDDLYGKGHFDLLREVARYLALWMSYEDAVRVADLKTRGARFDRVRSEVQAQPGQVLTIHEFLHPGLQEIADILPAGLGAWLLHSGWVRRWSNPFTRKGRIVQTTSLFGFLQLYALASLRGWRRKSLRFGVENKKIAGWLERVREIAPQNYQLAVELAECPRLVKGYGETHQRGSYKFDLILGALPQLIPNRDAALQLKQLREAALADEDGQKLAAALREMAIEKEVVG